MAIFTWFKDLAGGIEAEQSRVGAERLATEMRRNGWALAGRGTMSRAFRTVTHVAGGGQGPSTLSAPPRPPSKKI